MINQQIIFRERDTANNEYSIEFTLHSLILVDDAHARLVGFITMGGKGNSMNGTIEYWFNEDIFYRMVNKRNKRKIEINPLWNEMSVIKVFIESLTTKF